MDGEDLSKLPKEEDPFWEPPEDVLIGTASVFLQSLSYALDFDDKLAITDYKVNLWKQYVLSPPRVPIGFGADPRLIAW